METGDIDVREAMTGEPPVIDYVLPGLPAGTVGALVGIGGVGKSMAALQFAVAVAGGADTLGLGIESKGKVVYLAADDPETVVRCRLHAIGAWMDPGRQEQVSKNLGIRCMVGAGLDLVANEPRAPKWAHEAIAEAGRGARLLILDTLRAFHSADEGDYQAMHAVMGTVETIARTTGAAVLVSHRAGFDECAALTARVRWQADLMDASVMDDPMETSPMRAIGILDGKRDTQKDVRLVSTRAPYGVLAWDVSLRRMDGGVLRPVPAQVVMKRTPRRRVT